MVLGGPRLRVHPVPDGLYSLLHNDVDRHEKLDVRSVVQIRTVMGDKARGIFDGRLIVFSQV